jgi:hypothetical protein
MTIEALKLALDALKFGLHVGFDESSESQIKKGGKAFDQHSKAIAAIRTAIAAAENQEAWKTSDTAYRPEGLPQDFIKHEVDSFDDWSEWICPDPTQYFMKCCDCGLVHEMQFNVVKYSKGDECEDFDDPSVQAVFRARRTTPPAAQRQWVGLTDEEIDKTYETQIWDARRSYARAIEAKLREKNATAQRQPLTDEQIKAVIAKIDPDEHYLPNALRQLARAIEAAHGIKEKNT